MITLSTPIEKLSGIGPVYQKKLKRLKIKTVNDLIFHFPHRYEDFSNMVPISKVKINEVCTIKGRIIEINTARTWKRKMYITHAIIEDTTGAIKAIWFNQPYLTKTLKQDDHVYISGKVTISDTEIAFSSPSFEKVQSNEEATHTARLVPVYPETESVSSKWIRFILKPVLKELGNKIPETLPEQAITENNLMPINQAVWQIHFPDSKELAQQATKRFSFEELFFIQLFILRERMKLSQEKAISLPMDINLTKKLVNSLSFKLTDGQRKSAFQILKDLEKPRPMNRLLEGDVGSGKTIVAAIAALNTARKGYQVAFMAPTEILAKQHFKSVSDTLQDFNVDIGLLTGKQDQFRSRKLRNQVVEISRKKLLEKTKGKPSEYTNNLETGIDILIGTHALIQDTVKFGKLGLVILDEQHRFGVNQRASLIAQKTDLIPHLLSMTATPIPRTLALTIFGDLDLSIIDQLPKGRKKIITQIVNSKERNQTYQFIKREVKKGRQVFVICPRIDKDDEQDEIKNSSWTGVKGAKEEYDKLSKKIFPKLKISILHGKMTTKEKDQIMYDFKNKKTDILVSTSVVEVGVDIPNATVMMIEGSERFGLAQLHQFRGRVGRSKYQSYCFLFTTHPSRQSYQRLKALVDCHDGFTLAEKDLAIRGPGSFVGARQWGIPDLMMGSLKDIVLVEKTRQTAKEILAQDPELKSYPLMRIRLDKFRDRVHLE